MDRRLQGSGWGARQLLERCQKLFAILQQLPAEAAALQHLTRWWRALGDLGLAKALERPEPRGSEGTTLGKAVLRALARDQAASEALRAMYRELHLAFDQSGAGQVRLSRRECELLFVLASDPGRVFTKEQLLRDVWGYRSIARSRTLESHASHLRTRLRRAGAEGFVINSHGVGYKLWDGVSLASAEARQAA